MEYIIGIRLTIHDSWYTSKNLQTYITEMYKQLFNLWSILAPDSFKCSSYYSLYNETFSTCEILSIGLKHNPLQHSIKFWHILNFILLLFTDWSKGSRCGESKEISQRNGSKIWCNSYLLQKIKYSWLAKNIDSWY